MVRPNNAGARIDLDAASAPCPAPTLDIVVPVHNEAAGLAASIERLHAYLESGFPFSWRITIVDNASTDRTLDIADALRSRLDRVRVTHLDRKGRGLALRTAWTDSDASVLAYMDVDLSTGLDALLPLVAPLVSGHSDIAIGSRLSSGSNVARGTKRELISRSYNRLLQLVFSTGVRDAQCGFKAIRSDVAARLVPAVRDDQWFFDTELLLLAEHNGLRIQELPVDWIDDPDSRVDLRRTALADLMGVARVSTAFLLGRGELDLGASSRDAVGGASRRELVRRFAAFAAIGLISTALSLVAFMSLRSRIGPVWSVIAALGMTSLANAWAHRRFTLARRGRRGLGRHILRSMTVTVGGIVASVVALVVVGRSGGGVAAELVALGLVWGATTIARLVFLASSFHSTSPGDP